MINAGFSSYAAYEPDSDTAHELAENQAMGMAANTILQRKVQQNLAAARINAAIAAANGQLAPTMPHFGLGPSHILSAAVVAAHQANVAAGNNVNPNLYQAGMDTPVVAVSVPNVPSTTAADTADSTTPTTVWLVGGLTLAVLVGGYFYSKRK